MDLANLPGSSSCPARLDPRKVKGHNVQLGSYIFVSSLYLCVCCARVLLVLASSKMIKFKQDERSTKEKCLHSHKLIISPNLQSILDKQPSGEKCASERQGPAWRHWSHHSPSLSRLSPAIFRKAVICEP